MPLFRRSDGTLVPDLPSVRRVMPYLMRGRNECAIYVETHCDVTDSKKWLWAYNRAVPGEQCTFLHLFLYSGGFIYREFPQLDRFVSGRRIYQRKVSTASLTVKDSMEVEAPLYSVKLPFPGPQEPLPVYSRQIQEIIQNAKQQSDRSEREVALLLKLPDFLVRTVLKARQCLDDWNLLPASLLHDDVLYTTLYVSNAGSLGLPDSFHHLFEHGNCSSFAMIASMRKTPVVDCDGNIAVRDILPIRWTVDDRVADGFVYAMALKRLQAFLENPSLMLGHPEEAARGKLPIIPPPVDTSATNPKASGHFP